MEKGYPFVLKETQKKHTTKIDYDMLMDLLKDASWKWEHITPTKVRIFHRVHGNDFEFE